MAYQERVKTPSGAPVFNIGMNLVESGLLAHGKFIIEAWEHGVKVYHLEKDNVITWDGGILAARLFKDSSTPNAGQNNGLLMLAVGSGATGSTLAPDAPTKGQRSLNTELGRKTFASTVFRNADGIAVSYPTNIVDFTTVFNESEAVGTWNEMSLLSPFSSNPNVTNPNTNGPANYDSTIDVTGFDLAVNYLTFPPISKTATMVIQIAWRLSF